MKKNKMKFIKILSLASGLLFISPVITCNQLNAQTTSNYKLLDIKTEIGEGKNREVKVLFEGERRKIAQLTLRNGKHLESHSVEEPILIQCITGNGEVLIQNTDSEETIQLSAGQVITIEGGVMHDVIAKPYVSILLIRFLKPDTEIKN